MKLIDIMLKWLKLRRIKTVRRGKRICCLCAAQIKRAERWHYGPTGDPQHWYCDNPTRGPGTLPDAEPVEMVMP